MLVADRNRGVGRWNTTSKTHAVGRRARSAVDGGHVSFVVAFAGGASEFVEPFDLFGA